MHVSEAKSGARQDVPRRGSWKSSGPGGRLALAEAMEWLPPDASFPEMHSISVWCNTSGLNIGIGVLE